MQRGIRYPITMRAMRRRTFIAVVLLSGAAFACEPAARADDPVVLAVASKTSKDYARTKGPDGKFKRETYVFGQGGFWGDTLGDSSIDKVGFMDVAHTIAYPLADQNYVPSKDPKKTQLLIMVYWGTTRVPDGPNQSVAYANLGNANTAMMQAQNSANPPRGGASDPTGLHMSPQAQQAREELYMALAQVGLENKARDQLDIQNAEMLGYDSELEKFAGFDLSYTGLKTVEDDVITELEQNRYFVVLMAYDFQSVWKEKKDKLLWETRFSIRQRHNHFDKDLFRMAMDASRFFGQDSHGLARRDLPVAHVEIGDLKSLGTVPEK
jgi:hypothetical protein